MVCILKPVFICRASSSKKNIYRCCAANCEGTDHLYRFPKDLVLRSAWVRFIKTRLKSFTAPSTKTALCFRHFTTESFSNYGQYVMTKGTENSVRLVTLVHQFWILCSYFVLFIMRPNIFLVQHSFQEFVVLYTHRMIFHLQLQWTPSSWWQH